MVRKEKEQTIKNILKSKKLRITPQRFAVYANLISRGDHPTVEQILEDINKELPISSKASVYSALAVLRSCGLVREVLLEEGVTRFDAKVEPHHHFICENCGLISDLDWQTFADLGQNPLNSKLQIKTYEVIVRGICQNCQEQKN
jgi:Fe2+ or Zn2+ uptake regulation protein